MGAVTPLDLHQILLNLIIFVHKTELANQQLLLWQREICLVVNCWIYHKKAKDYNYAGIFCFKHPQIIEMPPL